VAKVILLFYFANKTGGKFILSAFPLFPAPPVEAGCKDTTFKNRLSRAKPTLFSARLPLYFRRFPVLSASQPFSTLPSSRILPFFQDNQEIE
jgi:hypothetical protein